jgi:hypothetical protein
VLSVYKTKAYYEICFIYLLICMATKGVKAVEFLVVIQMLFSSLFFSNVSELEFFNFVYYSFFKGLVNIYVIFTRKVVISHVKNRDFHYSVIKVGNNIRWNESKLFNLRFCFAFGEGLKWHYICAVQRFYILGRIWLMAVEARAPCGDCNNNNKVILIIILIKIITDENLTLTKRLFKKKILYLHN